MDFNEIAFIHSLLWTLLSEFETECKKKNVLIEKVFNLLCNESYEVTEFFKINLNINEKNLVSLQEKYKSCFADSLNIDQYKDNGRYRKEFIEKKLIGKGGFGQVFQVFNKLDKTNYALKKVRIIGEELSLNEALNEIEIWASLNSEFIVEYKSSWIENILYKYDYKYDEDDSIVHRQYESQFTFTSNYTLFIQMELCDTTLDKIMQELNGILYQKDNSAVTPIAVYIGCQLFLEVVEGLDYLHSQSPPLIHRYIKPLNILVKQHSKNNHFIKICDFGLTTSHPTRSTTHTKGRGTLTYIAPEVDEGRNYNEKSDIFSLGVLMDEIISNKRRNSFSSSISIQEAVINEQTTINEIEDHIDICNCIPKMKKVIRNILTLTSQNPEERPKSSEILDHSENYSLSFEDIKNCSQLTEFIYNCYTSAHFDNHLLNQIFLKHLNIRIFQNKAESFSNLQAIDIYFKSNVVDKTIELVMKKKVLHAVNICNTPVDIKQFIEKTNKNWKCIVVPSCHQTMDTFIGAVSKHFIEYFLYYDPITKNLVILAKIVDVFYINFIMKRKLEFAFKDVETNDNLTALMNCLSEIDKLDGNILENNRIFNRIVLEIRRKAVSIYFSKHKIFILTADRALYICDSVFFRVVEIELDCYDITQIVYNGSHVMLLTSDGAVYSWGSNKYGQLGNGTANNNNDPKLIYGFRDKIVVKVCNSYEHSVALTSDGIVYGWGRNNVGQVCCARSQDQLSPVRIEMPNKALILDISCGSAHTFALSTGGQIFSWGLNNDGQLGFENRRNRCLPTLVDSSTFGNELAIKVKCEKNNSYILTAEGNVFGTGYLTASSVFRQINQSSDRFVDIALNNSNLLVALSTDRYCYIFGLVSSDCDKIFISCLTRTTFKSIHNCFFVYTESQYTYKLLVIAEMNNHSEELEYKMIKKLNKNICYNPYISTNVELTELLSNTIQKCVSLHGIKLLVEKQTPFRCYFLNPSEQSIEQFTTVMDENQFKCIILHEQRLETVLVLFDYVYYRIIDFCLEKNKALIDVRRIDYFPLNDFQQNYVNFKQEILSTFTLKNWSVFRQMSPSELKIIKLFAIDYNRTFLVAKDDKVFSLGDNRNRCLGIDNESDFITIPQLVKELCHKSIVKFVYAADYMAALTSYGVVYTWGNNFKGQLSHKDENKCFKPKPINISIQIRVKNLYCGTSNMLILTEHNNLFILKNNVMLIINYEWLETLNVYNEKKNFFCSNNQNIFLITKFYLYVCDIGRHEYRFFNLEEYKPKFVVNTNCASMIEFKSFMLSETGDIFEIKFIEFNKEYKLDVCQINHKSMKFTDMCYSKSANTFVALSTGKKCYIINDKVTQLTETQFTLMENALAVYSDQQVSNQNMDLLKYDKVAQKRLRKSMT